MEMKSQSSLASQRAASQGRKSCSWSRSCYCDWGWCGGRRSDWSWGGGGGERQSCWSSAVTGLAVPHLLRHRVAGRLNRKQFTLRLQKTDKVGTRLRKPQAPILLKLALWLDAVLEWAHFIKTIFLSQRMTGYWPCLVIGLTFQTLSAKDFIGFMGFKSHKSE